MVDLTDVCLIDSYARCTPPPVVSDAELEAWGRYYRQTRALREAVYFDLFMSSPRRYCAEVGVPLQPPAEFAGAAPSIADMRHLLPRQRLVMGRTA